VKVIEIKIINGQHWTLNH